MTTWAETDWSPAALTTLASRSYGLRWLAWITVKDRTDNSDVTLGYTTEDEDSSHTLNSETRAFESLQNHLVPPVIVSEANTIIQRTRLQLIGLRPEVQELILTYEAKLAPVELHQVLFDGDMNLVAIRRRFKGFVNGAPLSLPPVGGQTELELELVSSARRGTLTTNAKKSDAAQQRRGGDRGRRYGSLGNVTSDYIGRR